MATFDIPDNPNIVYVVYAISPVQRIPIYVGQSSVHVGRFGQYLKPSFTAPTDFKVGTAIQRLRAKGYQVAIDYQPCEEASLERVERASIDYFSDQFALLNSLRGYEYTEANEGQERDRIQTFVDEKIIPCFVS